MAKRLLLPSVQKEEAGFSSEEAAEAPVVRAAIFHPLRQEEEGHLLASILASHLLLQPLLRPAALQRLLPLLPRIRQPRSVALRRP